MTGQIECPKNKCDPKQMLRVAWFLVGIKGD